MILSLADSNNMKVYLGSLQTEQDWATGIEFTALREYNKRVATEILQRYGHHPSLRGWYFTQEIWMNWVKYCGAGITGLRCCATSPPTCGRSTRASPSLLRQPAECDGSGNQRGRSFQVRKGDREPDAHRVAASAGGADESRSRQRTGPPGRARKMCTWRPVTQLVAWLYVGYWTVQ
jgi:hypothetical protein